MQEVGWHEEDVFNERFPKNSCNETRSPPRILLPIGGLDFCTPWCHIQS